MKNLIRTISVILTLVICVGMFPAVASAYETAEEATVYLSDIEYESASIGYGVLHIDGNMNDQPIALYVDGNKFTFDKGLTAHASSTLVYNLANYADYKYFSTYLGIDASQGSKGNAIFRIYTSADGSAWDEVYTSGELTAKSESEYISIDISEANYLKLYADSNGGNGNDHTTFADAKLTKNNGIIPVNCEGLKTLEEYDAELAELRNGSTDYTALLENRDFVHTLLKRTFVKNAGIKTLTLLCQRDEKYSQIISWLLNDYEILNLYILGGKPSGTYQKSLDVLYDLYTAHGDDMQDSEYGDLYKKMIITLSLTHSETVYFWEDITQVSDPVYRYEIYKDLHSEGLLWNDIFENLSVEEMRWVLHAQINDDDIKSLNTYVRENNSLSEFTYENWCNINGYNYIDYTLDYSYPPHPSIFDIFDQGAVCGGISKSSVNIREVFGIPGATTYQPGHCAWLDYRYIGDSPVIYIGNDVSGWTKTQREGDGRMPCGWGNAYWRAYGQDEYYATYSLLSLAALTDYDNYEIAEKLVALADVFPEEARAICRKALEIQNINLDAYYGLIMATTDYSQSESLELIQEIADTMYGYPVPMWNLINLVEISHNLTSDIAIAEATLIARDALIKGTTITEEEINQPDPCKTMAKSLLTYDDFVLATFSLDGEKANILALGSVFSENAVMEYSVDGGDTWTNAGGASVTLGEDVLSAINAEDDILVRIEGMERCYTIDVTKASAPAKLYNNDLENSVINADDSMEWSFDRAVWTSFSEAVPDLTGDKTVWVRYTTTGTAFASDSVELTYTQDNNTVNKSYITLDRVSAIDCSTEASAHGEYAVNAVDGDINTMWHTSWNANSDSERYITLELSDNTHLSAIDYVPRQDASNGRFLSCEVYTSLDGENWTLSASEEGWANDKTTKTITFEEPVYTKYVKLAATQGYGNFGSAAMINLYEDIAANITSALSGSGTSSDPFVISSADDLKLFANLVNYGVKNLSAYLTADLDLNPGTVFDSRGDYSGDTPSKWTSIGNNSDNAFTGTFDGKGYTIKGLYSTTGGLFGYIGDATIKNLKIENAAVKTSGNSGLLASESKGTSLIIENCSVAGYSDGTNAGGFIGKCENVAFTDCNSSASVSCSGYAGGYAGYLNGEFSFTRCSSTGDVSSNNSDAGGFIGKTIGTGADNSFTDCYTSNSVSGYEISGGFIGSAYLDFFINNCYKTGYIESNNSIYDITYGGAVVGYLESNVTIDNLYYTLNNWYENGLVGKYQDAEKQIDDSACYHISGDQFESGEVAFKLNGSTSDGDLVWGQEIGVDSTPVLGGKTVYYGTNCAGTTLYSNEPVTADHDFSSANGKCTKCGVYEDEFSALYGHSITLDGKVGLNYLMEIDNAYANSSTSMKFSVMNYDSETGQQNVLYTQSVTFADAEKVTINNKTYYKFTCRLAAKEMTCKVKAQLVNGDKEGTAFYYNVAEYAYTLLNDESYDNKTKELVISMLNYGANSQKYFNFYTDHLANCDLSDELKQLADTQADELSAYKFSYTPDESYTGSVSYYGSSLVLKSGTEIKHYFAYDSSKTVIDSFTCKDSENNSYEIAQSGSYLYVRVANIPAHRLDKTITLSLYENDVKVGEISYSPLSYVYSVLSAYPTDDGTHDNVRNLVKSLNAYYNKAAAYVSEDK